MVLDATALVGLAGITSIGSPSSDMVALVADNRGKALDVVLGKLLGELGNGLLLNVSTTEAIYFAAQCALWACVHPQPDQSLLFTSDVIH